MNCILSNNNAFVYDAFIGGIAGPAYHAPETFQTMYGLVYPLTRGWEIIRMLQDARTPLDVLDPDFRKRHILGDSSVAYLDWDGRGWFMKSVIDPDVGFIVNRIPQTQHTAFFGRELTVSVATSVNLALRDAKSYKEAFEFIEQSTLERFSDPVFVSLESHRANKPEGAINLPSLVVPHKKEWKVTNSDNKSM